MNKILTNIDKAIEILTQVPEETLDLKLFKCDTLYCAAGHLASDPFFIEQGFVLIPNKYRPGSQTVSGYAMMDCFGADAFDMLFTLRGSGDADEYLLADMPGMSDKQLAIARLNLYREGYE